MQGGNGACLGMSCGISADQPISCDQLRWIGPFSSQTKEVLSSLPPALALPCSHRATSAPRAMGGRVLCTHQQKSLCPLKCHHRLCRPGAASTQSMSLQNSAQRVLGNYLHSRSGSCGAEPVPAASLPLGSRSLVGANALFWEHKNPPLPQFLT